LRKKFKLTWIEMAKIIAKETDRTKDEIIDLMHLKINQFDFPMGHECAMLLVSRKLGMTDALDRFTGIPSRTKYKETQIYLQSIANGAFAKQIHKALKQRIRQWIVRMNKSKHRNNQILFKRHGNTDNFMSVLKIEYTTFDWSQNATKVYLKGDHKTYFHCLTDTYTEFLEFPYNGPHEGTIQLRGMVEIVIRDINRHQNDIKYVGRAFCMWEDQFDPLIGTVLAEYRLVRSLKQIGVSI
jgi:hypothetical protein